MTALLPHLASVLVEAVEAGEGLVRITVRTAAGVPVDCAGCGCPSKWEHSRYVRHVADEAIGGRPVVIDVSVRRLYCENPDCSKTTFVEQVPGLTARYQRRTPALQKVIAVVATALAGRAGARMLLHLHQTLSWASMLTCLLRIPLPAVEVPTVLGVDDFALRRGHRYATILIRYINQGRVESDRPAVSPRRFKSLLCTAPDQLRDKDRDLLTALTGSCPEMTALTGHISTFADLSNPPRTTAVASTTGSPVPARTTCPTCTPSPVDWNATTTP